MLQVQLNETQLSDIFFNIEKPNYEGYFRITKRPDAFSDDCRAALRKDADDFSALLGDQVSGAWLADNFYGRL